MVSSVKTARLWHIKVNLTCNGLPISESFTSSYIIFSKIFKNTAFFKPSHGEVTMKLTPTNLHLNEYDAMMCNWWFECWGLWNPNCLLFWYVERICCFGHKITRIKFDYKIKNENNQTTWYFDCIPWIRKLTIETLNPNDDHCIIVFLLVTGANNEIHS